MNLTAERRLELAQERIVLARSPELSVLGKGAVVRAGVALSSAELTTLKPGEVVIIAEERYLGSRLRARISKPVCGWVSRRCVGVAPEAAHADVGRVVVACDGSYLPLLELWMVYYARVAAERPARCTELHVLCLDDDALGGVRMLRHTTSLRRRQFSRPPVMRTDRGDRYKHLRIAERRAKLEDAPEELRGIALQMWRLAAIWRARLAHVDLLLR